MFRSFTRSDFAVSPSNSRHRHTRFRRQELAQDEINPDVLAMSGHIARRCSEQKRVRIPAMKVSEWGHLLRALEIERVCH
ncbi:hypothetical protein DWU25_21355 [Escherichia coli]|nr:hypothetical protein [Escherichia coli]